MIWERAVAIASCLVQYSVVVAIFTHSLVSEVETIALEATWRALLA